MVTRLGGSAAGHDMRPCGHPADECAAPGCCLDCGERLAWDGRGGYAHASEVRPVNALDGSPVGPDATYRTSRTVEVGDALMLSDHPLGVVTHVHRWLSRPDLNGWSAELTFDGDERRTITLTPGAGLPRVHVNTTSGARR